MKDSETKAKDVARHGEEGASHAVTYYAVVETAAQKLAWLSLKPVTGRTHQLRVHMATLGLPIIGDPLYPDVVDVASDDFSRPLQLLACSLEFDDPMTGNRRQFESQRWR